jgi:hypothetical protein
MAWVLLVCLLAVGTTTALHDAVLWWLNTHLPAVQMSSRTRLLAVMLGVFAAHALEISLYGLAVYALIHVAGAGTLGGTTQDSLDVCLYFSAETFSSLGYGDLVPRGPLRLLAGVETLNGLLLIGWSASFAYVTMERYWASSPRQPRRRGGS